MKRIKVIDASVAIKWFLTDEEKRPEALLLLDEIQFSPQFFAVPELFFNEMLAVFCKTQASFSDIRRYLYLLENLGLHRLGNGGDLLSLAANMATKYKISGYDAIYVATAKLLEGTWITADAKAHKRVERTKFSCLI